MNLKEKFVAEFFLFLFTPLLFLQFPLLNVLGYEPSALIAILFFFMMGRRGIQVGQTLAQTCGEDPFFLARQKNEEPLFLASPTLASYYYLRRYLGVGLLAWIFPLLIYGIHNAWTGHCNFLPAVGIYSFVTLPALLHGLLVGFFLGVLCPNRRRASGYFKAYFLLTAMISLLEGILGPRVVPHNLILGVADVSWAQGRNFLTQLAPSYYWHRMISILLGFWYALLAILLLLRHSPKAKTNFKSYPQIASTPKPNFIPKKLLLTEKTERSFLTMGVVGVGILLVVAGLFPEKVGFAIGSGSIRRHLSEIKETEHFILHVEPRSAALEKLEQLAEEHEWYYYQIRQLLGQEVKGKISSYIYSSEDQKYRLTSIAGGTWFANPFTNSIHVVYEPDGLGIKLKHEIAHIFEGQIEKSWRFWVFPPLVEGLAEMIEEDYWRGEDFHEELAAARHAGVLTPAPEVLTVQGFGLGQTSVYKSYDIAGSFYGFLVYQYGMDRLLRFCRTLDYEGSFGRSLEELGQDWFRFLERIPVRPEVEQRVRYGFDDARFPPFHHQSCPRLGRKDPLMKKKALAEQLLKTGQFTQAQILFAELAQQGNSSGYFRLREIETLRRQGLYDEAIGSIEVLYASSPSSVDLLNEVLEMRARLYLQAGRFEEAVKALDDWNTLEYDIRGAKQQIAFYRAVLSHKRTRAMLIQGIEASDPCSQNSQNLYRQALEEDPLATPAHYLLARCSLENPGTSVDKVTQEHAEKFLKEEPELDFAKIKLLRLLGKRAFQTGHLEQALEYFEQLPKYENHPKILQEVEEWRERIAWNRERGRR
jgi:tetratricopeptide (TPR) repeat protein